MLSRDICLLGKRLVSKELANSIISLDVSGWITSRALAYRILIHHLHVLDFFPVAFQSFIFAWCVSHLIEVPL